MKSRDIIVDEMLEKLGRSKFRSSFKLRKYMIEYINRVGIDKIKSHTVDFINKNLSICLENDGHQTPMKGHPVFIAQHATATCCRGCIEKWHGIPKNRELNNNEKNYIYLLIIKWIMNQLSEYNK